METKWSRESIVRWILERDAQGLRVLAKDALAHNSYMHRSAVASFGSWAGALAAAGVRVPKTDRHVHPWTPNLVAAAILRIANEQHALCYSEVHLKHRSLYEAARTHFGSWRNALISVGIDPISVRKAKKWDKHDVIEAILACAVRKEPLAVTKVRPRMIAHWAIRLFGSWKDALRAAGLDPKQYIGPRQRPRTRNASVGGVVGMTRTPIRWSQGRIAEALRFRLQTGQAMHMARIRREDRRLYSAIRHYFGSWAVAMRFAGFDPEAHRGGKGTNTILPTALST